MVLSFISSGKSRVMFLLLPWLIITTFSCKVENEVTAITPEKVSYQVVYEFTNEEISQMQHQLREAGYDIPETPTTRDINAYTVNAIKVSTQSVNPNDPEGELIDISGILLVPKRLTSASKEVRLVVNALPTYTENVESPSVVFENYSVSTNISALYAIWTTLTATARGIAVLMPDYPGFGDSYQYCFPPYVTQEPIVRTTLELTRAASQTLSENKYIPKKEILITGYSQGGFVATAFARELDLNHKNEFPIKLLLSGGTPANLKVLADKVREQQEIPFPFLLPYALCGFSHNGYPLDPADILLPPFDETACEYFDGVNSQLELNEVFPQAVNQLFTPQFIYELDTLPELAYVNEILEENSITPWKNNFPMRMFHSPDDDVVYEQCVTGFIEEQKKLGGEITLEPLSGDHLSAGIEFYVKLALIIPVNQ